MKEITYLIEKIKALMEKSDKHELTAALGCDDLYYSGESEAYAASLGLLAICHSLEDLANIIPKLKEFMQEADKKEKTAALGCDDLYYGGKYNAYENVVIMIENIQTEILQKKNRNNTNSGRWYMKSVFSGASSPLLDFKSYEEAKKFLCKTYERYKESEQIAISQFNEKDNSFFIQTISGHTIEAQIFEIREKIKPEDKEEYIGQIIDIFEDFLADKKEKNKMHEPIIVDDDYDVLHDNLMELMNNWNL